jgi:predicted phage terminase large subunit-like protein
MEEEYLLLKEEERRECIRNFWEYCLYMDFTFYDLRKDVLKPIAIDMQRLIDPLPGMTELDILNVSLPPRTGKSYLATMFASWALGKYPTESIMRNTVTGKLYKKFSNDLKDIIMGNTHSDEAHVGKYSIIFPKVSLASTSVEGWKLTTSKQGVSYFGAGIEGNIIGFGASLISMLDDSIADEFEALNDYALDKKWAWYGSASDSREEEGCKRLFIGTRWSPVDIVGRLIDLEEFKGDRAKNIAVAALNEKGTSYCESIHSTKSLLRKKKITNEIIWDAEWMQQPITAKGRLYPSNELNWYTKDDINRDIADSIISKVDTADKGDDDLSAPVGYQYAERIYIDDVIFTKDGVGITIPAVAQLCITHNIDLMDIESNNGGSLFASNVEDILETMDHTYTTVQDTTTTKNKETRILMRSGFIKKYFYFRSDYEEGTDYARFIKSILTYKKGGKNKHDDGPDSITGLAELLDYDPDRFDLS